ncbi:efflux RND transporter permease subunit [Hyphococcus sp.]|uniref:efflux RND transporter permease subunit n=1 Tax=Hyphococcus sp. TaxID=2038636 RepID=UPI003CCB968A
MWLVDLSIKRPVLAVMMIGALVVLGWISMGRLGVDLFPDVEFPYVAVTTTLEGASPDTMETEVSDVIEESVNTISGIKQLRSTSADGLSQVFIEFELEENVDVKAQDVRDKVNIARRDLPEDIDPPVIEKVDPDAAPIMSIMIAADASIGEITTYADEVVKEAVQRLPGVGSVTIVGGRLREIRIWLNADKMRAFGVTADDVVRAVRSEHAEVPGGRLEIGGGAREFGAKTVSEAKTPQEFADLVVAYRESGAPTRIGDVARVEDGLEDERSYAQFNGRPGVSLEVRRQSGRNTLEVAEAVHTEVERLQAVAPDGYELVVARDVSRFIESSVEDVTHELEIAIVLVVIVTFFFLLSWRATLMVAIAIPTSLISAFFAFEVFDFTINMLTLLALTVTIGLLVDDAIVVVESVQRDIDAGIEPEKAARQGTARVALAVLAGTFATLAVFVPIAFMEGIVGRFFLQYGLAIVFAVSVSLLVALTLTPMLASRFLKPESHPAFLRPIENFHRRLDRVYSAIVGVVVRWRYLALAAAIGSLFVGGFFASRVPSGFTSKADRSEFLGAIELPLGSGIAESKKAIAATNEALRGVEHVKNIFLTAGAGSQGKANVIDLYASITPKQERRIGQFKVMDEARNALREAVPEASEITVAEVPWISGGGVSTGDIELVIRGDSIPEIDAYVKTIMARMRETNLYSDLRSSFEEGRPELLIDFNRTRAGDLGVSARALATTARTVIGGVDAGTYEEGGRRYDVRVRLEESQRQDRDQLQLIQIRSESGQLIDLASVATMRFASGPSQIDRLDRARKISILANTASNVALGTATDALEMIIAEYPPPATMQISYEGSVRRMNESISAIIFAFGLAMVALYIVLASQFNSFVQPVVIMLTAPLSFSGAFAMLYFGGQEMSLFAQIGLIALMGIVMKNGILLVDRANQLREEGAPAREAILKACPERLRPVLMTAFAAIFGMIPVALSSSDGAEWRNSLGYLIIGGLSSSTILTLLVVPAAYMVPGDVKQLISQVVTKFYRRREAREHANV